MSSNVLIVLPATDSTGPTPPVRTSSIPVPDDTSSLTATSKLPPSEVGTEQPTTLNTNASSSQRRNSLLAVPTRTSSTKDAPGHSPTSTSSTAVTATGDADATSTTSKKRRRGRGSGSNTSSVTGEEGRGHKQGGIGRFFGFLCCRGASPGDEKNPNSRRVNIPTRPSSVSSRRTIPVGKEHKIIAKDSGVGDSKDVVEIEKTGEESTENKDKPEGSSVPPVILNSGSVEKDDDKIKTVDGEVLVGEKIVVKDNSAAEEASGASEEKRLSLSDTTPIVTLQAPTPTAPVSEEDDISSSEPSPTTSPGSAIEEIIEKEEDVEMPDVHAEDTSSDDGQRGTPLHQLLPPRAEEPPRGDSDSDEESDPGQAHGHAGELVQTPAAVEEEQKWLLPPVAPRFEGKKCLVLDLDETLVHSSFKVYLSS